jgi:hypothetical protein
MPNDDVFDQIHQEAQIKTANGQITLPPGATLVAQEPDDVFSQIHRESQPGVASKVWDKANEYAGRALSAAGLPQSLSDIPNWARHMVGMAPDSKPFWDPIHEAAKNPTQENLVNAVPLFGPAAVSMSHDVKEGKYVDAAITGLVTAIAPKLASEVGPGSKALLATSKDAFAARAAARNSAGAVKAASDLNLAIPATKSAPYTPADYQVARPYLEAEHAEGPIKSVEDLRDAADTAIGRIEEKIQGHIQDASKGPVPMNVLGDVKKVLANNPRGQGFVTAGLKDLQDFQFDRPKTLADADAIRRQLNAENKAVLKKNGYDVATARAADAGFAAREAAAESLRNGIYQQLEAEGVKGVAELRQNEGSIIKIRNAAQNQTFNGDKIVRSTAQTGPVRQVGKALVKAGAAAAGSATFGPAGAVVGAGAGDVAGNLLTPHGLTKDALVERSFSSPVMKQAPAPNGKSVPAPAPQTARPGSLAAQLAARGFFNKSNTDDLVPADTQ